MKYFLKSVKGNHEIAEDEAIEYLIDNVAFMADCGQLEALDQEIEALKKIVALLVKTASNKREVIAHLIEMQYGYSDITTKEEGRD